MLIFFVFLVQLPFYLTTQAGVNASQVGLAFALQAFIAVIIALLYYRVKARLSFQGIFSLIFLTLGINHLVAALTPEYGLVVLGLLVGGLGLGFLPPNLNVWVASITPSALRGRAVGGLSASLFLGQFFTPIITTPVVEQVGSTGIFGVFGVVSLLLAVAFVGIALFRKT